MGTAMIKPPVSDWGKIPITGQIQQKELIF
jgi:hypothetical protein